MGVRSSRMLPSAWPDGGARWAPPQVFGRRDSDDVLTGLDSVPCGMNAVRAQGRASGGPRAWARRRWAISEDDNSGVGESVPVDAGASTSRTSDTTRTNRVVTAWPR